MAQVIAEDPIDNRKSLLWDTINSDVTIIIQQQHSSSESGEDVIEGRGS